MSPFSIAVAVTILASAGTLLVVYIVDFVSTLLGADAHLVGPYDAERDSPEDYVRRTQG